VGSGTGTSDPAPALELLPPPDAAILSTDLVLVLPLRSPIWIRTQNLNRQLELGSGSEIGSPSESLGFAGNSLRTFYTNQEYNCMCV
jgi:hypothetical protein